MEKRYFAYDAMICSKAAFINAKFSKGKNGAELAYDAYDDLLLQKRSL